MLGKVRILVVLAIFCPTVVFGADSPIVEFNNLFDLMTKLDWANGNEEEQEMYEYATELKKQLGENTEELEKNYQDLKENEQSLANRTLTAATTAATGIGGMELAMGLSQQKADKDAAADMDAYIATFRCTYGEDKSVKGGPDEIELPSGNTDELMKLRSEYITLAADLKQRKEALGLKPGIEAEEILDKTQMGLYDDEFVGITSGNYESLYRAKALGSEADQAKIDENAKSAKNRVIAGGVVAGAGIIGGIVGNLAINKNGPKNRSEAILQERDSIVKEIKEFTNKKIDVCNAAIAKAQEHAKQIQSDSTLNAIEVLREYAGQTASAEKIQTQEDFLKENPFCR